MCNSIISKKNVCSINFLLLKIEQRDTKRICLPPQGWRGQLDIHLLIYFGASEPPLNFLWPTPPPHTTATTTTTPHTQPVEWQRTHRRTHTHPSLWEQIILRLHVPPTWEQSSWAVGVLPLQPEDRKLLSCYLKAVHSLLPATSADVYRWLHHYSSPSWDTSLVSFSCEKLSLVSFCEEIAPPFLNLSGVLCPDSLSLQPRRVTHVF